MKLQPVDEANCHNVSMSNQVVRATHELRLNEKRLICCALAQVDSMSAKGLFMAQQKLGFCVRVTAADYAKQFKVSETSAYEQIKAAGDLLFERHIRYEAPAKRGTVVHKIRWVSSAKYAKGEGWIELDFTPDVTTHLLGLRANFTSYKLEHTAELDSIYAFRLYELLKSWQSTGRYKVTLEEFNKTMETPASFRANFKDLRVRVIEPAIKSINARTDLIAQYSAFKDGRKVSELEFRFFQNPQRKIE